MPNKIDNGRRWLILKTVMAQLAKIRRAEGYNLQPLVSMEADEAVAWYEADGTAALWVQPGDEVMEIEGPAGLHHCSLEIVVNGYVTRVDGELNKRRESLLQDVRFCLANTVAEVRTQSGAGFLTFGDCENDEGLLTEVNRAWFAQPVVYQYPQGATEW